MLIVLVGLLAVSMIALPFQFNETFLGFSKIVGSIGIFTSSSLGSLLLLVLLFWSSSIVALLGTLSIRIVWSKTIAATILSGLVFIVAYLFFNQILFYIFLGVPDSSMGTHTYIIPSDISGIWMVSIITTLCCLLWVFVFWRATRILYKIHGVAHKAKLNGKKLIALCFVSALIVLLPILKSLIVSAGFLRPGALYSAVSTFRLLELAFWWLLAATCVSYFGVKAGAD